MPFGPFKWSVFMPVGKSSDPLACLLGNSSDPFLCLWVNQVIRLYAFWAIQVIRFCACGHIFSSLFAVLGHACGPKRADADERAVADERAGADESPCFCCYAACHFSMRQDHCQVCYLFVIQSCCCTVLTHSAETCGPPSFCSHVLVCHPVVLLQLQDGAASVQDSWCVCCRHIVCSIMLVFCPVRLRWAGAANRPERDGPASMNVRQNNQNTILV